MPCGSEHDAFLEDFNRARPGLDGLIDPCDIAVATLLQCVWDAQCDAIRALQVARRKTIMGGTAVVGVVGGLAVACPPAAPIAIIGGIIATGISALAGC